MIKRGFLTIVFIVVSIIGFSQFNLVVEISKVNNCQNDSVEFIAKTTNNGIAETGVDYKWDFGDGTAIKSGLDLDTIKHPYVKGGGYILKVEATKGANYAYELPKVQIGLTASFSKTEVDRKESICLGQFVRLTGIADTVSWKHKPDENVEENPVIVSNTDLFKSIFTYRIFDKSTTFSVATDIDTIGVELEHTNLSNIKIEMSCPEGNTVILKDFGGQDKYFGEPIDDESSTEVGKAYYYYWTNNPDNGTMNSTIPTGASLLAGSYTSDESFSNFVGCSLNGEWKITVTDNKVEDKGYVFSTRLKFNDAILPVDWEFGHDYKWPVWIGKGVSNTLPDGTANAKPIDKGNSEYIFQLTDNFGCKQDTSVFVSVEGASFTATPINGNFDLDVEFLNTTSWATDYIWDFGDETPVSNEESPMHTYTFPDDVYIVTYTAIADDGCEDTDTTTITVTIPDAVFNEPPNVFSPNNDGVNDFFKLDVDDIASLDGWIYSRWGKLVCRWKTVEEAQEGWNGKITESNSDAQPGVYYYYIKATDYFGAEIKKNGFVQLFH